MNKPRCQKILPGLAISVWVLVLACLAPSLVLAAPGDLDTSFGGGAGWVSTPFALKPDNDQAQSMIQQADGKLVVAGYSSYNGGNNNFTLVRYNSDGSLDTTFNGTGKLTTAIGVAYSVAQQADGKLVVAGDSYNGSNNDFALVRYNSDGSLDTTFSSDGKLTTVIGASDDYARSVIQQTDGKLVVAGIIYNGSNYDFALVRYNSNGTLDAGFNGTGKQTTDVGVSSNDYARQVIQQADGKLVVVGSRWNSSTPNFALVRYNSNGSLDTTFNGTGKLTIAISGSNDQATSVIQQADGKLVVAGGNSADFALARVNSNGTLDTTFSGDGKQTTAIGVSTDQALSVIQQADGKLVAAGLSSISGNGYDFALARYNSDGSLDSTFSGDGKQTTAIGVADDYARSVIQQADGKLVATGLGYSDGSQCNCEDFALVRYNSDGTLDTTFDTDGKLLTNIALASDALGYSLIQQADGKLVATGYSHNGSNYDVALARYNGDGTLDAAFNSTGKLITAIGAAYDEARSILQQADGKLVVAGTSNNSSNNDFALVRYNSDGTLDTSFNSTGKQTTAIGNVGEARSILQQVDGKLVAAGYSYNGSNYDFALVRYNSNGSLDTSFNGTGKQTTAIGAAYDEARSILQQADGKLVVAGYSSNGSNQDFALVRYNSDGTLDASFNGAGKLTTAIGTSDDYAYSVIQQADGKLVVAGSSNSGGTYTPNYDFALVRYNSDGTLDTSFNGTGKLTTVIGASGDYAYSVIQQADGKLVAAGYSSNGSNNDFALVRYNSNGTLDTAFNGTGKRTVAFGAAADTAYSVIQQADGKLVAAGYSTGMPTGTEFVVARFESGQPDTDSDGYVDGLDNCINVANLDQLNTDGDVVGNACDAFPNNPAEWLDTDNDGTGNNADFDDDDDGIPDALDPQLQWQSLLLNAPFKGSSISEATAVQ